MKRFVSKIFLFLLTPVVIVSICEIILPLGFFTNRPWEALRFATIVPHESPFYPNSSLNMVCVGDLCHHTEHAIKRNEDWNIDELGFRNNKYISDPDILIIGDSFIAGTGLSQESIFANQMMKYSKLKVYSMAPSSLSQFHMFLRTGKVKKPKILIYSTAERTIPEVIDTNKLMNQYKVLVKNLFGIGNANVYLDRGFRFFSLKWAKARIVESKGNGIPGTGKVKMFFLQGTDHSKRQQNRDLEAYLKTIREYKKYCNDLGIEFFFLPMPDKESVYYEYVPFPSQPNFLFKLDTLLKENGINTLNTLEIYNRYRVGNSELLYTQDDTHWNFNATDLISKEVIRKLAIEQVKILQD